MTEERGSGITENQLQELKELQERVKRTDKMEEKLAWLIAKRDAPSTISDTCIVHLADVFVSAKYGRNTDIENKYTNKGLMVEEDSMTLYSRFKKRIFTKNETWLTNEFISGTPDVIKEHVIDLKSSWDIFTFFRQNVKKLNKSYYWQLQGYMALTGAKTSTLVYCLIDTPNVLIEDVKRKLLWKMGVATELDQDYLDACAEIDKLSIYSDVPLEERIIEIEIERNDEDIQKLYKKVKACREYMNKNFFKL